MFLVKSNILFLFSDTIYFHDEKNIYIYFHDQKQNK